MNRELFLIFTAITAFVVAVAAGIVGAFLPGEQVWARLAVI
ncbi:MAG TPA: hypothetical protein VIL71_23675 [Spirillospora sp.]